MKKKIYCITFGQSHFLRDNWLEIEADNEESARETVHEFFGNKWGFIYDYNKFNPRHFPGGKAGRTLKV